MRCVQRVRARWETLPTWLGDGAIMLLPLTLDLSLLLLLLPDLLPAWGFRGSGEVAAGVVVATRSPLVLRRRYPRVVLGIVTAAIVLERLIELPTSDLALYIALFTVALRFPRRQSLAALGLVIVVRAIVALYTFPEFLPFDLLAFVVSWTLGDRQQSYRVLVNELEYRAEQLKREREANARLAAAGERARIARDLHDVLAHSVSVMVLHAAAARRTLKKDLDRAEEALAQVEATGRQSLTELRRMLGVLRNDGPDTDLTLPRSWPISTTWSTDSVRPDCQSRSRSSAILGHWHPEWICPPTGSSRRR